MLSDNKDKLDIINVNLPQYFEAPHLQQQCKLLQKISQACEEYGFFQVINHGVSEELCEIVMIVVTQFFELSPKERAEFFTEDITKQVRLFNYYLKSEGQEKVTMWSEIFSHPWNPVDDFSHLLPQNPPQYRYLFSILEEIIRSSWWRSDVAHHSSKRLSLV